MLVQTKECEKKSNFAQDVEEESKVFMVHSTCTSASDVVWFLDSGCYNHTARTKSQFK